MSKQQQAPGDLELSARSSTRSTSSGKPMRWPHWRNWPRGCRTRASATWPYGSPRRPASWLVRSGCARRCARSCLPITMCQASPPAPEVLDAAAARAHLQVRSDPPATPWSCRARRGSMDRSAGCWRSSTAPWPTPNFVEAAQGVPSARAANGRSTTTPRTARHLVQHGRARQSGQGRGVSRAALGSGLITTPGRRSVTLISMPQFLCHNRVLQSCPMARRRSICGPRSLVRARPAEHQPRPASSRARERTGTDRAARAALPRA